MDARRFFRAVIFAALLLVSMGASHRSANFVIQTEDPQLAARIAATAEQNRKDLAVAWLGKEMPDWSAPCVMNVRVGENLGAGGATTFVFDRGEVFGWRMSIQGSQERILDSVLPHEITHMIFASHFRQPLPRWADEGAATSVEHASERAKHHRMLEQFLRSGRGIAFNRLFAMTEYPPDVMPLYAQGHALVEYLIQQGGRRKFVAYLEDALQSGQWVEATRRHYGSASLGELQNTWLTWVREGRPEIQPKQSPSDAVASGTLLADARSKPRPRPEPNLIHRVPRTAHEEAPADGRRSEGVELAMAEGSPARVLPAAGWQTINTPSTATTMAAPLVPVAVQPQLARPQPVEQSRQIILEWRKP